MALEHDAANACWACGRRGGKTLLASIVALYDCVFRPDLDALVRRGERRYSVVVATNVEQARILVRSAKLIVDASPLLRRMLVGETANELLFELADGSLTALKAFPCSSRGIRGYAISTGIMDEAAAFVSTEDGNAAADQVYKALGPATAQFGTTGRMLVISSPMGPSGFFAGLWAKVDDGKMEGWSAAQISTAEMNPSIPRDFLEQLERDEPDSDGTEYLALFETGTGSQFFELSRFEVDPFLEPAPASAAVSWVMGMDPALSSDSYGLALIGIDEHGRRVVGPVEAILPERKRGWTFERKRAAQDRVLSRVAELCRAYSARTVSDQHESQAITARLRELGVSVQVVGMTRDTKLAAFRELRDRLYSGDLVLPQHDDLLAELARVGLKIEQGGAKVILPRSSRGHCDMAQALSIAAYALRRSSGAGRRGVSFGGSGLMGDESTESWLHHRPMGGQSPGGRRAGRGRGGSLDPDRSRQSNMPPPGWPGAGGGMSLRDPRWRW